MTPIEVGAFDSNNARDYQSSVSLESRYPYGFLLTCRGNVLDNHRVNESGFAEQTAQASVLIPSVYNGQELASALDLNSK